MAIIGIAGVQIGSSDPDSLDNLAVATDLGQTAREFVRYYQEMSQRAGMLLSMNTDDWVRLYNIQNPDESTPMNVDRYLANVVEMMRTKYTESGQEVPLVWGLHVQEQRRELHTNPDELFDYFGIDQATLDRGLFRTGQDKVEIFDPGRASQLYTFGSPDLVSVLFGTTYKREDVRGFKPIDIK